MKHKHHDTIIAWVADTTQVVENRPTGGVWHTVTNPIWHEDFEYRIQPQPKPDVVREYVGCSLGFHRREHYESANLRLTFDGETGKLKAAEVLL